MNENKQLLYPVDCAHVTLSEAQQVEVYVAYYLRLRNYADSKENKNVLTRHVHQYPERGTVWAKTLTEWLDALLA